MVRLKKDMVSKVQDAKTVVAMMAFVKMARLQQDFALLAQQDELESNLN